VRVVPDAGLKFTTKDTTCHLSQGGGLVVGRCRRQLDDRVAHHGKGDRARHAWPGRKSAALFQAEREFRRGIVTSEGTERPLQAKRGYLEKRKKLHAILTRHYWPPDVSSQGLFHRKSWRKLGKYTPPALGQKVGTENNSFPRRKIMEIF